MERIQAAISLGSYDRSDFFDTDGQAPSPQTFREYSADWLETIVVEKSTRRSYRTAFDATWRPAFGEKTLSEIRHSDIARAIAAKAKTTTGKTVNNQLVPLRGMFDAARRDGLVAVNPTDGVRNLKHQKPEPDPFDRSELLTVLAHMAGKYDPQVATYYAFAFNTGLRPSEQISLPWENIDFRRRTALIDRARVDWEDKDTKTNTVREIDLNDAAMDALKAQKAHTFLIGGPIFHNPKTGRPWADEQSQRRLYWNPSLKALGIRQRDQYQTRHTYASLLLTGGVNPAYIAKQLGHSKVTTTLNTYARWIERADKGAEAAKANAIMSGDNSGDNSGERRGTEGKGGAGR